MRATLLTRAAAPARGEERRACPRVDLRLPLSYLEVVARPPANRHGVTLDVSRSGVRFRSEEFLPPRAFVALNLSLPGRAACAVRGRTIWSRRAAGEGHWEVGAEFLSAGGDADAALAEALALRA
jgi:hypothetical protein